MKGQHGRRRIAVVGAGISGLSAAWMLGQRHDVVLYDKEPRLGGHSNTVAVDGPRGNVPVDTGFIVYNEATYPNLSALFSHLGVRTVPSEMSFAVSRNGGTLEYSGSGLGGLFAQKSNLARPAFWSMLSDLVRFYRTAAADLEALAPTVTLGDYLDRGRYGAAFRQDHLLPMAGAIWSAPCAAILDYPARSFISFYHNHGLLMLSGRPQWRTVDGGSIRYVQKLATEFSGTVRLESRISSITRQDGAVIILDERHGRGHFDDVVIATHGDQALGLLADSTEQEQALLGAFRYSRNEAVLHTDASMMPRRRAVWSSWNHVDRPGDDGAASVTYWMNRLQALDTDQPLLVTLNPRSPIDDRHVLHRETYHHPLFDRAALQAQEKLWGMQGIRGTWFCGAHFGSGFHEDGLQSGLAVAEALGGVKRPWTVAGESSRLSLPDNWPPSAPLAPAGPREMAA